MKKALFKKLFFLLLLCYFSLFSLVPVLLAREGSVLGVHILNTSESIRAKELLAVENQSDEWHFVTIPYTLDDVGQPERWQEFFNQAKQNKIIPIVRLVSRFENGSWQIPDRKELVDQISSLAKLEWPTENRYIILFNEVNHAPEWGGKLDPVSYAQTLRFASQWAHSEDVNFRVMAAAMDLAAPNGSTTMEAFNYLEQMYQYDPNVFDNVDIWNSHSYPNPGFSSSPQRTGKNSLRGFEYELAFAKEKTGRDFQVMITETGWVDNATTSRWLASYYTYALQHIWNDPRILAVTPFILQGDPGPFSGFSFLTGAGEPTSQYLALQQALVTASN